MNNNNHAWSQYWLASNQSCIGSESDQQRVNALWQQWLSSIDSKGRVLDLATGNGAVINAFLQSNTSHHFDAVDYAEIIPQEKQDIPQNVSFHANTDIEQLPFEDAFYDGVVSQFGFEYADTDKAAGELVRVCKTGAKVMLIAHHQQSEILKANSLRLTEINWLLQARGVIASAVAYSHGEMSQATLEQAGQQFLQQYHGKLTKPISGHVFESINQVVIDYYGGKKVQAKQSINELQMRLLGEQTRLTLLNEAALSNDGVEELISKFNNGGLKACYQELNTDDGLVLAWLITGERV